MFAFECLSQSHVTIMVYLSNLQEELGEVIDENTKLQHSLEQAYISSETTRVELDSARKEAAKLKKQLNSVNCDVEQMKHKKDSLADDKQSLAAHVQQLTSDCSAHAQESARLQQVLADLTADMEDMQEKYMSKIDECEQLRNSAAGESPLRHLVTSCMCTQLANNVSD